MLECSGKFGGGEPVSICDKKRGLGDTFLYLTGSLVLRLTVVGEECGGEPVGDPLPDKLSRWEQDQCFPCSNNRLLTDLAMTTSSLCTV